MARIGSIESPDFEMPTFRLKRPHKKSRLGCAECKRRRVKCDETRPGCTECKRRRLSCIYEDRSVRKKKSGAVGGSPDVLPEGASPLLSFNSSIASTELMQHFLSHTVEGLAATSTRPEHAALWKVVIPALAYTASPVRLGLCTAGAMCMHYDALPESDLAEKYLEAAEFHGEHFVSESRAQAHRFDSHDFDSILACSRLLTILGFAFYRSHRRNGVNLRDAAAWRWLQLLRGVKTVYKAMPQSEAGIDPIMSANMVPEIPFNGDSSLDSPSSEMRWFRKHECFQLINTSHEERIRTLFDGLISQKSCLSRDEVELSEDAIVSLGTVTKHICIGEVHSLYRAICTWPATILSGFTDMLVKNQPFALVVYAHWLMLVVLADSMWWVGDMGVDGIREIAGICSTCDDPEILKLMEWPLKLMKRA